MKKKLFCIVGVLCALGMVLAGCGSVAPPASDIVYTDVKYTAGDVAFTLPQENQWEPLSEADIEKGVGKGASAYYGLFARSNALKQLFSVAYTDAVVEDTTYTAQTFAEAQQAAFTQQYESTGEVFEKTVNGIDFYAFISDSGEEQALQELYMVHQHGDKLLVVEFTYGTDYADKADTALAQILAQA